MLASNKYYQAVKDIQRMLQQLEDAIENKATEAQQEGMANAIADTVAGAFTSAFGTFVTGVAITCATPATNAASLAEYEVEHPGTLQLIGTVAPATALEQTITWTSSDATNATVGATTGLVTTVSTGPAVITATTKDGGIVARVLVTVIDQA